MKIACIGWGSLIWNPRRLLVQKKWFDDGPLLKIEFTRISSDDRVTLIIDDMSKPVRTLWTLMTTESLDEAKKSLKDREGTSIENIHCITSKNKPVTDVQKIIKKWLSEKKLDAAIWTGLSYNGDRPDIDKIVDHLDKKIDRKTQIVAEEYIRKAPKQIDTEYRKRIEREFGWTFLESTKETTA